MSVARQVFLPFTSFARWYTHQAKSHPLATAILTSGIKTSAADIFAQKVVEGRDGFDYKRHALFCCFGFGYLGCVQYWLYNIKFVQWCAPITARVGHKGVAPVKVFLDQAIHHPFVYFPVFYSMKAGVERKPMSYAIEKYKSEIWESCKALWAVWVPSQLVNFAFVPRHFRVPWVAGTSFVWTIILSLMQSSFDAEGSEQQGDSKAAHYAAVQVLTEPPTPAVVDKIFPPTDATVPVAAEAADPAHALLPASAVAALETPGSGSTAATGSVALTGSTAAKNSSAAAGLKPPVKAASPLEQCYLPNSMHYSFSPHSMAAALAARLLA